MSRQLIVVDVETTGLDTNWHWPIEIAAINANTGEEFYFVPNLEQGALDQADGKAMQINRYFERGVFANRLSKPDSLNKWLQLWDALAGNTLGGSNPTFDGAMLNRGYAKGCGDGGPSPWHHRLADLSAYAAAALHLGPHELIGLPDVCAALGVKHDGAHTAMGDARATVKCFEILTEKYTTRATAVAK